MDRSRALILLLALAGCPPPIPPPPLVEVVEEPPPPVPEGVLSGVPGWLGHVVEGDEGPLVVELATDFAITPEGTALRAVGSRGIFEAVLQGQREDPDCGDRPVTWFSGPAPEGDPVVWVLPPARAPAARPLAIREIDPDEVALPIRGGHEPEGGARAWEVGPLVVLLRATGRLHGELILGTEGRRLVEDGFEKYFMHGAPDSPLDLWAPDEVSVPFVAGAWELGPGEPMLVALRTRSYEGRHLALAVVERGTARLEGLYYLHACAY